MSRTQIPGNRIANNTIKNNHLHDEFVIAEKQLVLNHATHGHQNKSVIDIITNSNPGFVKEIDLLDVSQTILEVEMARDTGKTLKETLDLKIEEKDITKINSEIDLAKGEFDTLADAFRAIKHDTEEVVGNHAGIVSHEMLDKIVTEIIEARGYHESLKDKIEDSAGAGDGGSSGGTINITMLTPWIYEVELEEDQLEVPLPNTYTMGGNGIQVFEGPFLLSQGIGSDYMEVDESLIKLNEPLPTGSTIRVIGVGAGVLFEWVIYTSLKKDQDVVQTIGKYTPGKKDLFVYESGLLLQSGVDYEEINPSEIKMTEPCPVKSNLTIYRRRY